MKVAIVCDLIVEYSGNEKVLDGLLDIYPESDLYSLFITKEGEDRVKKKFEKVNFFYSPFQLIAKYKADVLMSMTKVISWLYWEFLDLSKYDLVFSLSGSYMAKNVKKRKDALHLAYIHTPPRYLYEESSEINWIKKLPILGWMREIDKNGAKRPDILVANSINVAKRIKKYWGRESVVIYPPVEIEAMKLDSENYYLYLGRLTLQKGVDLIVRCCTLNNLPLVVAGDGKEREMLESVAGDTVRFVGKFEDKDKAKLLCRAKAVIFGSNDEDFGIVPVEAIMSGVPVVAPRSGGVVETVEDGKTGIFFDKFEIDSLKKAIDKVSHVRISQSKITELKLKFGKNSFRGKILKLIESKIGQISDKRG